MEIVANGGGTHIRDENMLRVASEVSILCFNEEF